MTLNLSLHILVRVLVSNIQMLAVHTLLNLDYSLIFVSTIALHGLDRKKSQLFDDELRIHSAPVVVIPIDVLVMREEFKEQIGKSLHIQWFS